MFSMFMVIFLGNLYNFQLDNDQQTELDIMENDELVYPCHLSFAL